MAVPRIPLVLAVFMPLVFSACKSSDVDTSDVGTDSIVDAQHAGSIGDGPIMGSTLTITDSFDQTVLNLVTDSTTYNISLKQRGNQYPLTFAANGGVDLVTNGAPDFELLAVTYSPSIKTVNLNPHSTFISKVAMALPGAPDRTNVDSATELVLEKLHFGMQFDPMFTTVTPSNVHHVVKASEMLGEMLRRTRDQVALYQDVDADRVVDALAADLVDGTIDGIGAPGAEPWIAAIANVVSGQVVIEALTNDLRVNGVDAEGAMDASIATIMPEAGETAVTSQVPVTDRMIVQALLALEAARSLAPNPALDELAVMLSQVQDGNLPHQIATIIPLNQGELLDTTIALVTTGDSSQIEEVNAIAREERITPPTTDSSTEPTPTEPAPTEPTPTEPTPTPNTAPTISGTPVSTAEVNTFYSWAPEAQDADGDTLTFGIENKPAWASFDTTAGTLSGTPNSTDTGVLVGIVISVSDGVESAALPAFDLTVEEAVSDQTLEVTPEQFGAKPDGTNRHSAIANMFAYLDSEGGGRVVLSPGTYLFNGDITVNSPVTITGTGTLRVDGSASYALNIAGDYSRIESGVTIERGSRTLTITGDHVFVDATVRDAGSYGIQITNGDYCTVGSNAKSYNAGYAGMRLSATRYLNRLDISRFESINHRYKGFVYNGTGGVNEINIAYLRAVTNSTEIASDGLLIDSGDSYGGTIRVNTLRVGNLHVEGHASNGFKIQNTRHIELGDVYNRNVAVGYSASSGGRMEVGSDTTLTWNSMNSDHRIALGGASGTAPGSAQFGRISLVGNGPANVFVIKGSGYTYSINEIDAQSLSTAKSVVYLDNSPAKLAVGTIYSAAKPFSGTTSCPTGSVTVDETVGYSGSLGSCAIYGD